ncbi:MAG TPA: Gfo/Idh/MocA family oxidoreductase [Aliidongia sp.]|nr:Gfo/Idh/MocA family oxidoreductase [Aliidongia sp.]
MAPVLRLGVAGLGRAFMLMLPTLVRHPRIRLTAAADPRPEARDCFARDFQARGHDTVEALCADPSVDAVYIASPHQFHVDHVRAAAAHGKHILVEKPMALAIADCLAMIDAARGAGVHLLVGHSHSYDLPYLRTRALIETGSFGRVRMINALNFTDYLYRPRRPEELDTAQGGGAIFSQAPHQVEIVRLLAGSRARSVRASAGIWDPARRTEGAYAAHLVFEDGAFASLGYNGHGHFDTDELHDWIGELGQRRDPTGYGEARRRLIGVRSPEEEVALKNRRAYGTNVSAADMRDAPPPPAYNHFGLVIVSCEGGDLRPTPTGVHIYADEERRFEALPLPDVPRAEVIDELVSAVIDERPPLHTGAWGMATTEICLSILESSTSQREIALHHQVGLGDRPA